MVRNDGDHPRDAIARVIGIMHKERDCHLLVNWYSTAPPSSADYLDHRLNSYHKSQEVVQTRKNASRSFPKTFLNFTSHVLCVNPAIKNYLAK